MQHYIPGLTFKQNQQLIAQWALFSSFNDTIVPKIIAEIKPLFGRFYLEEKIKASVKMMKQPVVNIDPLPVSVLICVCHCCSPVSVCMNKGCLDTLQVWLEKRILSILHIQILELWTASLHSV